MTILQYLMADNVEEGVEAKEKLHRDDDDKEDDEEVEEDGTLSSSFV